MEKKFSIGQSGLACLVSAAGGFFSPDAALWITQVLNRLFDVA